jgi:hypothetical protein
MWKGTAGVVALNGPKGMQMMEKKMGPLKCQKLVFSLPLREKFKSQNTFPIFIFEAQPK